MGRAFSLMGLSSCPHPSSHQNNEPVWRIWCLKYDCCAAKAYFVGKAEEYPWEIDVLVDHLPGVLVL